MVCNSVHPDMDEIRCSLTLRECQQYGHCYRSQDGSSLIFWLREPDMNDSYLKTVIDIIHSFRAGELTSGGAMKTIEAQLAPLLEE